MVNMAITCQADIGPCSDIINAVCIYSTHQSKNFSRRLCRFSTYLFYEKHKHINTPFLHNLSCYTQIINEDVGLALNIHGFLCLWCTFR